MFGLHDTRGQLSCRGLKPGQTPKPFPPSGENILDFLG